MFSFLKKHRDTAVQNDTTDPKISEILYKQNLELALKNKTLSLLKQLYQISVLSLAPQPLAFKMMKTVLEVLDVEMTGIFLFNKEKDTLVPLGFSMTDRFVSAEKKAKLFIENAVIPEVSKSPFFQGVFKEGEKNTPNVNDVWGKSTSSEKIALMKENAHTKTVFAYALMINQKLIGVFLMCRERANEKISQHEKELAESVVEVIAVAIDRAQLYQELKTVSENQSDLLHFVSHQVKGFLTNTKAALSMVLEGDYGPITKPVHDIVEQTFMSEDRGVTMVQSFLNAARIDDGAIEYTMKEFDLKKLVEDVVRGEENPMKEKGLTLTFTSIPDSVYTMKGDAIKMREVIFNLIDNALKYTPQGSVQARLERLGNTIRFSVKDNGVGIPKYDQEKIFTKYGHGRDSKKVNVHSNGLGLYLVKNVVEKHSGKAWFTSDTTGENKGTTFFVEVPGV